MPGVLPRIARPAVRAGNRFPIPAEKARCLPSTKHPQNKNDAKKKAKIGQKKL
jgi:hypothetical protein